MTSSERVTIEAESATATITLRMVKTFVCEMKRRHAELNRVWFQRDCAANQTA
jgi:hypothetical protein